MARWKLSTAHYLNVPGTEWEYTENDRYTGEPKRIRMPVPRLLDPKDPRCWTNRWGPKDDPEGEIIVCHQGKGNSSDVVFIGDPTPDMIPIDEEAQQLSASFEHQWSYKPDTDYPGQYSQSLIDKFQIQMAEVEARPVQVEGLNDLVAVLAKSVEQNQELVKVLAGRRMG